MFSLVSRKFLAMRNITLYSVRQTRWINLSTTVCYFSQASCFCSFFMMLESGLFVVYYPSCNTTLRKMGGNYFELVMIFLYVLWNMYTNINAPWEMFRPNVLPYLSFLGGQLKMTKVLWSHYCQTASNGIHTIFSLFCKYLSSCFCEIMSTKILACEDYGLSTFLQKWPMTTLVFLKNEHVL